MNTALVAALWGWLAGSSLLIGASIGWFFELKPRLISSVMAFGSGVLFSAVSFELMDEAYKKGDLAHCIPGFLSGVIIYTLGARVLNKRGAKFRKRSGNHQRDNEGNAKAIALGALLDGIPESIVIGLSLLSGKGPSAVMVFSVLISNIPEALSSSTGMKKAGRSKKYIFTLWGAITLVSGVASYCGFIFFGHLSQNIVAALIAFAAGAILSMIVDTMIPEAYEEEGDWAGVITGAGFLVSFVASKLTNHF